MTIPQLITALKTTGYPVAYSNFKTAPTIPYITILVSAGERGADYVNLIEDMDVRVELYTDKKDLTAERKVKDALSFTEFDNDETYIDGEDLFLNVYSFSITQKIGG